MKELNKIVSTERKMLRMMCGVALRGRISSLKVAERVSVELIEEWVRRQRLRWFGYVLRRGWDTEVGRVLAMEVAGTRGREDQQENRRILLRMILR